MSQIIKNLASGPVPPAVPTSFVTDDGTSVPALNIENVNGVDSTENNVNGILTRANPNLSNNMQIVITNRLQGTASTIGAVTGDVITFSLGATPGVYAFEFRVGGFNASTPAGLAYFITGGARTTGAAATIIGTPDGQENEEAALNTADWDVIASGNNIILRVTGVVGLTINWSSVASYTLAT